MAPADVSVAGGVLVPFSRESDTTTYVAPVDDASLAFGKDTYFVNCASCHGKLGEGGIGPNLTDDYWLHGDDFSSVVKSVRYGYPTKGMVPWLGTLQPDHILRAAGFVMTLRGTNPPNPKAPEGELVSE
jgi:cytochrome c oxidase cbb3-type subunit 3